MDEVDEDALVALHDALEQRADPVRVTLTMTRATAEKVLHLLETEGGSGAVVVPVKEFFTTTESASLLGISRASLMKLIAAGEIDAVMVGTHHRVPVAEILAYQQARQVSRERAAEMLGDLSSVSSAFTSNVRFGAERRRPAGTEGESSSDH